MQELHHWASTELKLDGYEHGVILDKIESMLHKEKEVIMNAYTSGEHQQGFEQEAEEYYNETFNTKDK